MPQIEEIVSHLRGVWLLIKCDRSGYDWLDISASGVLRSLAAFLWCLPPMAIGWATWRLFYLANMPEGAATGVIFIVKLFVIDSAMWFVPLIIVAALARPLGFAEILAPVVIATNWLSVPIVYAMAVPSALQLVIPGSGDILGLFPIILLIVNFVLIFRLMRTIAKDQLLLASVLTGLLTLTPLMLNVRLPYLLGVMPG
ncbi:hypothetical protein [Pararhizobium gei]|uniref:hypothetical protein n=1 Tax=Pararhizobium gei TaxID=1395951 RepID=UPI0023DCE671|nr:hypothetical protein [Rhizobium gei]